MKNTNFSKIRGPNHKSGTQPEGRACFYGLPLAEFNKTKVELVSYDF
ncbi:hypothetical protein SAMN05444280_1648 [Tangfeifania diversioriginum]|uniref:Uncharacterized protein n=1 Tax=Tangfeifania diversioriginum TaxID=1168035 RepID=A0A1M6PM36_9BACT|nr:hypothetical protein [Tangfeifania diversioriginum]SHK08982.1 hypothetical protein SAMN05444280_1648 [Tangfeifania diversioriginum]